MAYPKTFLFGANGTFRAKNVTSCIAAMDPLQGLFYFGLVAFSET